MKKFIIALMAFALVITLAGCGGGGGGGGSSISPRVATYNGLKESATFVNDANGKIIKEEMDLMSTNFASSTISVSKKTDTLKMYISDSFHRGSEQNLKDDLISTMNSRFDRYIINEWGFKVTDFTKDSDTQITTECSIRLDLVLKEGKKGNVTTWNDAVIKQKIVWVKEKVDNKDVWRIKSGFPYDRNKDFNNNL